MWKSSKDEDGFAREPIRSVYLFTYLLTFLLASYHSRSKFKFTGDTLEFSKSNSGI